MDDLGGLAVIHIEVRQLIPVVGDKDVVSAPTTIAFRPEDVKNVRELVWGVSHETPTSRLNRKGKFVETGVAFRVDGLPHEYVLANVDVEGFFSRIESE